MESANNEDEALEMSPVRNPIGANMSILLEPSSIVHHLVHSDRARWAYFSERCGAEGRSKAEVARLAGAAQALGSERSDVTTVPPRAVAADTVHTSNTIRPTPPR